MSPWVGAKLKHTVLNNNYGFFTLCSLLWEITNYENQVEGCFGGWGRNVAEFLKAIIKEDCSFYIITKL